jgi:hypothetical protein
MFINSIEKSCAPNYDMINRMLPNCGYKHQVVLAIDSDVRSLPQNSSC